jgi:hypothetical protein
MWQGFLLPAALALPLASAITQPVKVSGPQGGREQPGMVMEVGDKFAPIPVASSKARQEFVERYLTSKPRQALRP